MDYIDERTLTAFGHAIRAARLQREETQLAVARALGIDNTSLSAYETGKANPPLTVALRLSDYLAVDLRSIARMARPQRGRPARIAARRRA